MNHHSGSICSLLRLFLPFFACTPDITMGGGVYAYTADSSSFDWNISATLHEGARAILSFDTFPKHVSKKETVTPAHGQLSGWPEPVAAAGGRGGLVWCVWACCFHTVHSMCCELGLMREAWVSQMNQNNDSAPKLKSLRSSEQLSQNSAFIFFVVSAKHPQKGEQTFIKASFPCHLYQTQQNTICWTGMNRTVSLNH